MFSRAITYFETEHRLRSALGILLLLIFVLAQFSSSGVVRGGDDNDGSGIGGTGRALTPSGEGGIGGTGFKPFIGLNSANQEVEILRDPALQDLAVVASVSPEISNPIPVLSVVPGAVRIMREHEITLDSAPIDISEAMQITLDTNAVLLAQLRNDLSELRAIGEQGIDKDMAATNADPDIDAGEIGEIGAALSGNTSDVDSKGLETVSWSKIAELLQSAAGSPALNDKNPDHSELASLEYASSSSSKLARPDTVQRPQLPPIQRVSPLQRTAILPPRVQPMRL